MYTIFCNYGTSAASRCMNSSGDITRWVVPSRQGVLSSSTTCPAALVCMRLVGQSPVRDVAAQLLQRLAVFGAAARGGVQAESVDVGAQRLLEVRVPGHRALQRQHLLAGAWAKGDAIGRARTRTVRWTVCAWRGAGPRVRRGLQGHAAACNGLSTRASSESLSLSAMQVWPCSSTSTPLRVSSFISQVISTTTAGAWCAKVTPTPGLNTGSRAAAGSAPTLLRRSRRSGSAVAERCRRRVA